jgi:hypothetical protein
MDDLYGYLLKDEQLKGMFENWGYDDKVLVSRCNDLLTRIKSYLYIFDYEDVKTGARKDLTFNDACLNNILQIRKLLTQLPKSHVEALQKLGIIIIAPSEIRSNPFIPFNDIVLKNMEKVFSDILGLQSSTKESVLANAKFKTIIRGIDFKTSEKLEKTRNRLLSLVETGNVNLIKDVLSLFSFVERLDYHLQRCEVDDFRTFCNDRACMDAISYTLVEALKTMTRASEDTKKHYSDLGIDLPRLSKIHLAIVKRGITPFELINENYYMEELWSQIKVVIDSAFALADIALR